MLDDYTTLSKEKLLTDKEVLERLLEGKFVKISLKKARAGAKELRFEKIDEWILEELLEKHLSNEDFARTIHFKYKTKRAVPVSESGERHGDKGTSSPPETSFIYLDVGGWVGTKNASKGARQWGNDPKGLKRDFGVVCGPVVMLCTYSYAFTGQSCAAWETNKKSQEEPWKSLAALIDALSSPSKDERDELGKVIVRDVMRASSANAACPKNKEDYVIHVILGDMHIPVLDDEIQTFGGSHYVPGDELPALPSGGQPFVLHTPEGDRKIPGPHDYRNAFEPVEEKPGRVPRLGRLEIGGMEALVTQLVGASEADGVNGLKRIVGFASSFIDNVKALKHDPLTLFVGGVTVGAVGLAMAPAAGLTAQGIDNYYKNRSREAGVAEDLMSVEDAKKWYTYYRVGVDGKSADIFEEAGEHLLYFVRRLVAYATAAHERKLLQAKFLQLGDMVDFWVGFTCHYTPAASPSTPVREVDKTGRKMLQAWTANIFGNTAQGQMVAEAMHLLETHGLRPRFLYGNHDNYLGNTTPLTYTDKEGKPKPLHPREALYAEHGLFMEHGHQWEPSNADSKDRDFPAAGTLCPLGMWVTQAAFLRPGPIRQFEGRAAGLVARKSGTYGQRMDQVIGAAARYWTNSGGFYCYVMGHTHEACLSRVVVSSGYEEARKVYTRKAKGDPNVRVYIRHEGEDFDDDKFIKKGVFDAASVFVVWQGMLCAGPEWVALEDPYGPRANHVKRAVKDLAISSGLIVNGAATFGEVPPGVYQAHFYLDNQSGVFKPSHNKIAVCGISIEGDPENIEGRVFEFDPATGFKRPIFLRFAFDPKTEDEQEAWFVLHRAGTVDLGALQSSPTPHPLYRFLSLNMRFAMPMDDYGVTLNRLVSNPLIPMWGRWGLTQHHPRSWDLLEPAKLPYGDWEVSAFSRSGQFMCKAAFTVKQAAPNAKK